MFWSLEFRILILFGIWILRPAICDLNAVSREAESKSLLAESVRVDFNGSLNKAQLNLIKSYSKAIKSAKKCPGGIAESNHEITRISGQGDIQEVWNSCPGWPGRDIER